MKHKIIILSSLILLCSCTGNTTSSVFSLRNYNDYEECFITTEQIFSQNEKEYYIYFFSMYCNACYGLKQTVFDYLDNGHSLYFVDCSSQDIYQFVQDGKDMSYDEIKNNNFHAITVQTIAISSIPCLLEVKEHKVENTWIGFQECSEILKETT